MPRQMERSETVCRYCGVSYLIFHEFHQLHTRLTQMEADLQELREAAQREKALREVLEQDRHNWERTLRREVQERAETRERNTREELEERSQGMARAMREELEAKIESARREVEEEFYKVSCEKERQLREELEELRSEELRKQRDELERRAEEREKVLSDALQKSNKNSGELRNNLQQLEERLTVAAATDKEAEQTLAKEKQRCEVLRIVCMKQKQALQATVFFLRTSGSSFADIRGFLSQLKEAWLAFTSQMVQLCEHLFSELSEELQRCSVQRQKKQDENECLLHQLMEQRRLREEQLSQQENSEKEHTESLLRERCVLALLEICRWIRGDLRPRKLLVTRRSLV
ncbi:trichohyalin-like [Salarias fasciatus]|uniref:trichohyalin-like n=1 Tax=Salarias fasciatus TaxID=181472 RepID=UPI0011768EA8|nr:trichohyalin-like [Salarias fasciatus]